MRIHVLRLGLGFRLAVDLYDSGVADVCVGLRRLGGFTVGDAAGEETHFPQSLPLTWDHECIKVSLFWDFWRIRTNDVNLRKKFEMTGK